MAINTNGQWIPDYPGQYPAQDPAYMNYLRQQTHAPQQQQPAQQTVQPTAPTVYRADIIPVDDEQVVLTYFVQPGTSRYSGHADKQEAVELLREAMESAVERIMNG